MGFLGNKSIPKLPVFPAAFIFSNRKNRRPDLLMDFRASGDKWKTVRSWLRAALKVKD
jgi:hypothetical protein